MLFGLRVVFDFRLIVKRHQTTCRMWCTLLYWSDGTSVATLKGYWSNLAHLLYGYIEVRTSTP